MSDNAAAALKGASLAFRSSAEPRTQSPPPPLPPPPPSIFTKPKLKAKPSTSLKYGAQLTSKSLLANDGSTRDSGSMAALQAANISTGTSVLPAKSTIAGRHPARLARPELSPRRAESPGSSVATATSGMAASTVLPGVRYLYPPGATAQPDPKSPSYIAASLAANRAVSPDPSQATRSSSPRQHKLVPKSTTDATEQQRISVPSSADNSPENHGAASAADI
ncbi:hypothetical protein BROUX41_005142 [Berkeleyomyces rouxiae]|uniref:uncharacterized protein n=1 Tax=Berkeleyomyces rouxiae TaxID=2035830 RepID=UPI003B7E6190